MNNLTFEILTLEHFNECSHIWKIDHHPQMASLFYDQIASGKRITYVARQNGLLVCEASIVFDMEDDDYTIPGKRAYFSRFLTHKQYRGMGIGSELANFIFEKCKEMGLEELSAGIDLDNFKGIKIYQRLGFDKITYVGEDEDGKYLKLLKTL